MYYLDNTGKRVYTLKVRSFAVGIAWKFRGNFLLHIQLLILLFCRWPPFQKETPAGKVTESAHPARFSPDDKFSAQRVALKKRFGIYMPDKPQKAL